MKSVEDLGASHGWRLQRGVLPDGRRVFAKTGTVSPLFTSEAAGLLDACQEWAPLADGWRARVLELV